MRRYPQTPFLQFTPKTPKKLSLLRKSLLGCLNKISKSKSTKIIHISKTSSSRYPIFYSDENGSMFEYVGLNFGKKILHLDCAQKRNGCSAKSTIEILNPEEKKYKKLNFDLESFKRTQKFETHSCNGFDIENPRFIDSERDKFLKEFILDKLMNEDE